MIIIMMDIIMMNKITIIIIIMNKMNIWLL